MLPYILILSLVTAYCVAKASGHWNIMSQYSLKIISCNYWLGIAGYSQAHGHVLWQMLLPYFCVYCPLNRWPFDVVGGEVLHAFVLKLQQTRGLSKTSYTICLRLKLYVVDASFKEKLLPSYSLRNTQAQIHIHVIWLFLCMYCCDYFTFMCFNMITKLQFTRWTKAAVLREVLHGHVKSNYFQVVLAWNHAHTGGGLN